MNCGTIVAVRRFIMVPSNMPNGFLHIVDRDASWGKGAMMYASGNVTVYVSNMDRAVKFYSETLGLKLAYRFGDNWASVEAGRGLTIGLHPASGEMPAGR